MGDPVSRLFNLDHSGFCCRSASLRRLGERAKRTQHVSESILTAISGTPLVLFLIGLGLIFYLDAIPPLPTKLVKYPNALLAILFVWIAYLFFDRLMAELLRRYGGKVDLIASASGAIKTLYRAIILGFALVIILDQLKITITPLIASLGIGSLVIGLALQDTLSNFFSGISVWIDKPIRVGDYVKLEAGEGYVTHIGWRSTRIRLLSNKYLIVPNAKVVGSPITNYYLPELTWGVSVHIGVGYESDLEKVERVTIEVAKEVLRETEGGVKEFEPLVRFHTFGDYSIKLTATLQANEYANQYIIIHEFIKRLHRRYQSEGIEIPSSLQTLQLRSESSIKRPLADSDDNHKE
jgi:small-conductance mechanosensitive channel